VFDPKGGAGSLLLEWARRHARGTPSGNTLADLRAGMTADDIVARRGMPRGAIDGIRTFYDQIETGPRVCDGTACHFGGADHLAARLAGTGSLTAVRCLGHCYAAPAFQSGDRVYACPARTTLESWLADWGEGAEPAEDYAPTPRRSLTAEPVVLRHLIPGGSTDPLADYDLPEGDLILTAIAASGLRGRGGAAYATAAKWRAARDTAAPERFVVANGDEGDPGSFVVRLLLEEDPHAVLASR
jgi:hypothetical protein